MSDKKYNLVIVDDEVQITTMIEKYLNRVGTYSVKTYNDPVNAINNILKQDVDIVLLDIMMPKMDGIEVLDQIKEKRPNTKVIMMTAYSTLDRVLKSHKIGAENYIMKPFDSLSMLDQKIKEVLAK